MKKIKPDGSKTIYVGGVYEVDKTSGGALRPPPSCGHLPQNPTNPSRILGEAGGGGRRVSPPAGCTRTGCSQVNGRWLDWACITYEVRFYSPYLNQFTQHDSISPAETTVWKRKKPPCDDFFVPPWGFE